MRLFIPPQIVMVFCVFASCENHKVLYPIVVFYSIYVMHNFKLLKIPAHVFLHYQNVIQHIMPMYGCSWMALTANANVSLMVNSSAFPVRGDNRLFRFREHRFPFVPCGVSHLFDFFRRAFSSLVPCRSSYPGSRKFISYVLWNFPSSKFSGYLFSCFLGRRNPFIPSALSFVRFRQFLKNFFWCFESFIPSNLSAFKSFVPWDACLIFHAAYDTTRAEV